jgi:hypothetical protein
VLKTYRAGKTDFLNVLNSLQTLFRAQNDQAVSEGQIVQYLVTIYRALGGGWDPQHHCLDRSLRLQCHTRGDAKIAEQIKFDSLADQYFEVPDEKKDTDNDDTSRDETDRSDRDSVGTDSSADEDSAATSADDPRRSPTDRPNADASPFQDDAVDEPDALDALLNEKVSQLEQRLKEG